MQDIDIDELMAPLGPFERPPVIAVAVSGGSDSTGLGLLLAEWAVARGGHVHVLTVDHGLRPESAGECAHVARFFAAIPACSAHVLRWDGEKPTRGIQAAARSARYQLLTDWCRAQGVLHLAVAHTADDQAETVVMRDTHGSGIAGLAGMATVRPERGVRLLRPLLPVSRRAIRAWLEERGQSWIEDPSNELTKFERVRVRRSLDADRPTKALGLAIQLGEARDTFERAAARVLAEGGHVHDGGYASLALATLMQAPPEVQAMILRQMMLAVGGGDYARAPDDLLASLGPGGGSASARTLGGCIVQVRQGGLFVCRELAAIAGPVPVVPGWSGSWDRRFRLAVAPDLPAGDGWAIAPMGEAGLRQAIDRFGIRLKRHRMPLAARLALPALWRGFPGEHPGEQLAAQPHLMLGEGLTAWPQPRHAVTTCGFTVAVGRPHTIYSSVSC